MDAFIESYGPITVFLLLMLSGIGIPLGEDIITIPAGILIAHGKLSFGWTLLAAYVGVIAADILWFYLCGKYGTHLLHRRWFKRFIHPRRLLQAKHQIEERGVWFMVIARFVPSTRTTAITVSGLLHMNLWKFTIVELSCVAITAPLQIGLGWLIGTGIGTQDTASLVKWVIAIGVLAAVAPVTIGWIIRFKTSGSGIPRAKAKWLRRFRQRRSRPDKSKSSPIQTDKTN